MNKLLIALDTDISRCEEVLQLNDYLEIVITVEEIVDKYKYQIEGININSDRVWNYTKKDLNNILDKLKSEKNKMINEYIKSEMNKNNILHDIYYKIKSEIESNEELEESDINNAINIIDSIYNIGKENKDIKQKWDSLKQYVIKSSEQDVFVASKIILLINTIIKN